MIDYATWAEKRGIKYSTFSTHQVGLTDILEIAKESNITFQKGDILFIRIGVTKEWDTVMTDAQKQAYSENSSPEHAGVEATEAVLRWLWDSGFAAIASDAISWEVGYPKFSMILPVTTICGDIDRWKDDQRNPLTALVQVYPPQSPDIFLHEYVLAGWGMPIGKLQELENHSSRNLPANRARGTFRSRGTSTILRGTSTVDLFRDVRALEHAWWSLVPSKRDGDLLVNPQRELVPGHVRPYLQKIKLRSCVYDTSA